MQGVSVSLWRRLRHSFTSYQQPESTETHIHIVDICKWIVPLKLQLPYGLTALLLEELFKELFLMMHLHMETVQPCWTITEGRSREI